MRVLILLLSMGVVLGIAAFMGKKERGLYIETCYGEIPVHVGLNYGIFRGGFRAGEGYMAVIRGPVELGGICILWAYALSLSKKGALARLSWALEEAVFSGRAIGSVNTSKVALGVTKYSGALRSRYLRKWAFAKSIAPEFERLFGLDLLDFWDPLLGELSFGALDTAVLQSAMSGFSSLQRFVQLFGQEAWVWWKKVREEAFKIHV